MGPPCVPPGAHTACCHPFPAHRSESDRVVGEAVQKGGFEVGAAGQLVTL